MKNLLSPFMSIDSTEVFSSDSNRYLDVFSSRSSISIRNAQTIAEVFACINLKANAFATTPLEFYEKTEKGKIKAEKHSLYRLLKQAPNPNLTAFEWKKMLSQDLDLRGNHYAQLIKNGLGEIVAIYPLRADLMTVSYVLKSKNKEKLYNYNGTLIPADRILHIIDIPDSEGLVGISRIAYARNTLEFANNAATHGNKLFKNQATPSGAFTNPSELSDTAFERLKIQLEQKYSGLENSGKPLLLEGGLTFSPISLSNSDSQWLESRKLNRENIGSIFGVPTSMLNDTTATAYGNLEQKYFEFNRNAILPIVTAVQEKMIQVLLTPKEKMTFIIEFNSDPIEYADTKTKIERIKILAEKGAISPNEIRQLEGLNPYDGGDNYFMQLSYGTVNTIIEGKNANYNNNFPTGNKA